MIHAATIEALNKGLRVFGIMDGFKHLVQGRLEYEELSYERVSRIHLSGGSILRTSRTKPTDEQILTVIRTLEKHDVRYLITIGGDDTATTANRLEQCCNGAIRVIHIPKTIDNDLPLPGGDSTFGYQTARHVGVSLVQHLMEDARTTQRWFFVITMGRKTGHLALGIGKAAGATLTVIAEEFGAGSGRRKLKLDTPCKILVGAIIKRRAMGREFGVAMLAEGLIEMIDPDDLMGLVDVERDEHGHIRYAEIDFGRILARRTKEMLKELNLRVTIVSKDIGYELRCADPIPFDLEYTRDLGYGGALFLFEGRTGAMLSRPAGRMVPLYLRDYITADNRLRVRYVDTTSESYKVARQYMIRLERSDFDNPEFLERLAGVAGMTPEAFRDMFEEITHL
jgi:6-phosphofructokinase 1